MAASANWSAELRVRCPDVLPEAIDRAANQRLTTRSEYVREAVIAKLRADGFDPAQPEKGHL
jgi:hypothetical protein